MTVDELREAVKRVRRWRALPAFSKPSERKAVYPAKNVWDSEQAYNRDVKTLLDFACEHLLPAEQEVKSNG